MSEFLYQDVNSMRVGILVFLAVYFITQTSVWQIISAQKCLLNEWNWRNMISVSIIQGEEKWNEFELNWKKIDKEYVAKTTGREYYSLIFVKKVRSSAYYWFCSPFPKGVFEIFLVTSLVGRGLLILIFLTVAYGIKKPKWVWGQQCRPSRWGVETEWKAPWVEEGALLFRHVHSILFFFFFYLATEFIMCLTLWHIRILTGAEDLQPPQPHAPGLGLFEAREVSAASQALSTIFCNWA